MGIFKKLKDVLFDVEEEEIPVITKEADKASRDQKQEKNPIKEIIVPKENYNDKPKEEPKRESSFNFPLDFDEPRTRTKKNYDFDEDFDFNKEYSKPNKTKFEDERVKEEPKRDYIDYSKFLHEDSKKQAPVEPFKPTPIISPVYGILDQNYTKDDVIVKTDMGVKGPDLDEVRKKAYGINKRETKASVKQEDEFTEPMKTLDEILMEKDKPKEEIKPVKETHEVSIETTSKIELLKPDEKVEDDELPDEPYADEEPLKEDKKPKKSVNNDDTLETDLFNLIDSMYEEKNESEEEEK